MHRETESNLQTWNFDPIPSESRNWTDENLQGKAVHENNYWILKYDAQPKQSIISLPKSSSMAHIDLTQLERASKASSKIKRLRRSVSQRRMPRETEKPPLTMIDEKPTDGTSTSKKDQDGHGVMKSENCSRVPNPDDELNIFLSRWSWSDECWFFRQIFRVRTHVVATTICTTVECTYTQLLHAHFSAQSACTITFAHFSCVSHTRTAQVSAKRCVACTCLWSLSRLLPSHASPILADPARSLRDFSQLRLHWRSRPHVLAVLTCPKSAGHTQLRTSTEEFGYLAKFGLNTGYEPKKFDENTSMDDDTTLISDPDHNISDISKTTNENTSQFGVHTVFESSVLHVSHDDFALQIERAKKACNRETVARQREKEKKEQVLWSVLQSRCQRRVNGTVFVWVWRVSENSFLMDEISKNIFNEELNKPFQRKIQIRENCVWMSTKWRSKIQSEEIQNTHWLSHSVSLNLKDDNYWKPIRASSTWGIHLCSRQEMKDHLLQEVAEKVKNCKDAAVRKEITKNNEDWKIFLCSMIRNREQWVHSSPILTYQAVMTHLRSSSSSCYLEFKKA